MENFWLVTFLCSIKTVVKQWMMADCHFHVPYSCGLLPLSASDSLPKFVCQTRVEPISSHMAKASADNSWKEACESTVY